MGIFVRVSELRLASKASHRHNPDPPKSEQRLFYGLATANAKARKGTQHASSDCAPLEECSFKLNILAVESFRWGRESSEEIYGRRCFVRGGRC